MSIPCVCVRMCVRMRVQTQLDLDMDDYLERYIKIIYWYNVILTSD